MCQKYLCTLLKISLKCIAVKTFFTIVNKIFFSSLYKIDTFWTDEQNQLQYIFFNDFWMVFDKEFRSEKQCRKYLRQLVP